MRSLVTSIFLYACESWTLTAGLQRRLQAMEMRCYGKILHISYKDHVTYEEVCAWTTRRPDHRKETQTEVVRTCLPFVRSGQTHLARHSESGKKTRQSRRGGKTTSESGQAWNSPSPRGQWRTGKNGGHCEIICGAPATLADKD